MRGLPAVHSNVAKAFAIVTLGQPILRYVDLYFNNYILHRFVSLKMSWDFWPLAKVTRKRGRDIY
jgi:hypothetical protein